jgi:hypothetical protein
MKIVDQIYQCTVPGQDFGTWQLRCYLRIFQSKFEQHIVVVSDTSCETGWFFPYKIEQLAIRIVQKFQLNSDRLIWIEHCPADICRPKSSGFSQVFFEWEDGQAKNPQWRTIDNELVAGLIGESAQLVAV